MYLFFYYYLTSLIFIILFWTIGYTISTLLVKKKVKLCYQSLFFNIFIGINTFTILNSIFYSQGKTIFILSFLFLPFIYWAYITHKKQDLSYNISIEVQKPTSILISSFCFFTIIFLIRFFDIYYFDVNMFLFVHPDYLAYGRLGYWLKNTGVEHFLSNPIFSPQGLAPYHYFDNWLNVGLASIGNLNYSVSWILVSFSITTFGVWLGFCSILDYIKLKNKVVLPWLSFIALGISGVYISEIYSNIKFLTSIKNLVQNIWIYPKLSIIYLYLCAILLLFLKGKNKFAYILLLFLTFVYTTTAPAIFCSLGFMLAILLFQNKKSYFLFLLSLLIVSASSLWVFYSIFKIPLEAKTYSTDFFDKLKITRYIFIDRFIYTIILYFIPCMLTLFFRKKAFSFIKNNSYTSLIFLIPFFGLLCSSIFTKNADSHQIFENISLPILNILTFVVLGVFLTKIKIWICISLLSFFTFHFIHQYKYNETFPRLSNTKDLKNLYLNLKNKNHIGASFRDVKSYKNLLFKNTNWNMAGSYISTMFSDLFVIELNVHQIPIDSNSKYYDNERIIIKNAPFYKYVDEQKKQKKYQSIEESQISFIQNYNIDFIILDKEQEIPKHLNLLVKKQIYCGSDKFLFINN